MIQLHLAEGSKEGTYKVVKYIECVLEQEVLFCTSHMKS